MEPLRSTAVGLSAVAVTPSDTGALGDCRALWVGVGGNLRITTFGGQDVTFTGVQAGTLLPVAATRVWATNTTASGIVAVW